MEVFSEVSDSEVEKKILNKIDSMRRLMTKETGVTPSLSLDDAKDYLIEILDEIKKIKKSNSCWNSIWLPN